MARLDKKLTYQGLKDYPVYKEDTDNTIFNVVKVPEIFPQGKSYFLMLGSKLLRQGSDVLIEILDSRGQVIYYEVPKYLENAGRAISVWIYDHIVPGEAFITIVGELTNVPQVWKNKPNLKRTFRIFVNPQLNNKQPIKFNTLPVVTASYVDRSYLVWAEDQTAEVPYNLTSQSDGFVGTYDRAYSRNNLDAPYYIRITGTTVSDPPNVPIRAEWSGARFEAASIVLSDPGNSVVSYKGTITKLLSTSSFEVYPPITGTAEDPPIWDTTGSKQVNGTIIYYSAATGSASELTASFVQLKIKDLFTFSGDVDTIKVYKKNRSADTAYYLLGQYAASPTELFLESGSINQTLGTFSSNAFITANWTSSKIDGTAIDSTQLPDIYYSLGTFQGGVVLQQWSGPIGATQAVRRFKFYPINGAIQTPNFHEYTIKATYNGTPDNYLGATGYITTASLGIYISGSAVNHDVPSDQLGKQIGFLTTNANRNYGELEFNVITDHNGVMNLNFVVFEGIWTIADISIMAATDPGFNPDELTIYAPLGNTKRNELATFRLEFINSIGDPCVETVTTIRTIKLINQAVYMEESDNLVIGKLSLASSMERGIILVGDTGSAIKSYAYEGMALADASGSGGFMQYSGSALPGYEGVGFELNAGLGTGSLDFRYSPPANSYLYISASIFALPGSNVGEAIGGGFWTESADGTITRESDVQITGSLYITGDFIYVSSSIIYASGSTKFGDSLDDTHQFTGSVSITGALNIDGPITSTEYFPTASWAWNVVSGSGYSVQAFGSSYTWSFAHNLAHQYVNIEIYNSYDEIVIPQKIIAVDSENADIYFNILAEGTAVATFGGHNWPPSERMISIGGIATQSFSSAVTWSFDHNLAYKHVLVQTYDTNSYQMMPSNVLLIDQNNLEIYFTPGASGIAVASIGGSSIVKQATIALACSDEINPLTSSATVTTFYMPYEMNLNNVKVSLNISSSQSCSIDIKRNGSTIFDYPLIISASSYTSSLIPSSSYLAEDDRIAVDILQVSNDSAGLKVYLVGY